MGNVDIIKFEPIDLDNSKHQASVYIDDHNESYSFIWLFYFYKLYVNL